NSKIDVNRRDCNGNTALRIAYWNNNYIKVKTLIDAGAVLYPPLAISIILPLLARETEKGQTVNREDIPILENIYPEYYEDYIEACQEWQRMQQTLQRRYFDCQNNDYYLATKEPIRFIRNSLFME
ncbi:hypothetical protein TSAR_001203, partial [Trichomalopsis sarcophagae]